MFENIEFQKGECVALPAMHDESSFGKCTGLPKNLSSQFEKYGREIGLLPELKILLGEESKKVDQAPMQDAELKGPINEITRKALLKDADLFPAIQNADGSTTYSLLQTGITDRPGLQSGENYYSRKVDITVPMGTPSLDQCQFNYNERELISEDKYNQLLKRDTAASTNVDIYTHGVFASDRSSDKEALMLQLTNGRPTVSIDWAAHPVDGGNEITNIIGYERDTFSAKRAANNKEFEKAIDKTIEQIGPQHTDMIGFSHGGMFDARYLKHRVESNLPRLDAVILNHPDLPINAPELRFHNKPDVLERASSHAYVIGSQNDHMLQKAVLVDTLLLKNLFESTERLGDLSPKSQAFIRSEGADPITDKDQLVKSTNHFLNYAGISQVLNRGEMTEKQLQIAFDQTTDLARETNDLTRQTTA